jgi:hypothetical protein
VAGAKARIVATFSFYENKGASFSASERRGFYGRTQPIMLDRDG